MRIRKSRYLALEDVFDSRIPLRSEEEFRVGIAFAAKLVGSGNVARPSSRMEIVASMRRIRSECKSRKDKKDKVDITVSYEGVKVSLPSARKSNQPAVAFSHPIHRIFYVSHDSLDLHVFSYIAREGSTFKCFVFKAAKQSLAINIVRTIGQAFELCHKMTLVKNETAINPTVAPAEQRHVNSAPVAVKELVADNTHSQVEKYDASLVNSISQGFSTDMRMLQRVDSKLDKLADKVELLEKQITILLKNLEIKVQDQPESSDDSSGKSSCQDITETSKAQLLKDLKCLDQSTVEHKLETSNSEKLSYLLSPDSLLSSPVLHPTNTGSCLLFNDLY